MYQRLPSWVLGFHGTHATTVKRILNSSTANLRPSKNDDDWLGDRIYFWENDPERRPLTRTGAIGPEPADAQARSVRVFRFRWNAAVAVSTAERVSDCVWEGVSVVDADGL